jgi:O-antigen/teichoic acid export membrane protein
VRSKFRRLVDARSGGLAVLQTAFANIMVQGLNVASGILTARTLAPAGRGSLAAIIMWPQFLAFAMSLGLPVATVYSIKRNPDSTREIAGTGLLLSVAVGLLATLIGFTIIPYSLHTYPKTTIWMAQLWVTVTPLELIAVTLVAQVQAAGAFSYFNLWRFLSPLSVLVVLVIEHMLGRLTITGAAFAYLLAGMPATVWIGVWVWRQYRPTYQSVVSTSRLLLSYGVRAWGGDLMSMISNQVDRLLVVGFLNPKAMGLYIIAQSAAGVLAALPAAVLPIALPRAASLDRGGIVAFTGRAVRVTFYVMVTASLPLLLFGGWLLRLVYGPGFEEAAIVLPFLVVEAIADGLTSVLAQAFLAAGFPGAVSMFQGCGLLTAIPLLYWMIPRFGLPGAGCALLISTLCRFLAVLISFPYKLKFRPPGLIMGREELSALLGRFRRVSVAE